MSAPSIDLGELRARTPLEPLVSRRVKLQRRGKLQVGCCPFHGEKTPSFTVYPDGHFHCFGCRAHGDAIGFTMRADGLGFHAAVERLAAEAGMSEEPVSPTEQLRRDRAATEARRKAEAACNAKQAEEDAENIAKVQRRLLRTVTAADTLAERYLVEIRRIPKPVSGSWPDSLRYDAHTRALVAVATDAAGVVRAAQWVYLTPDAHKIREDERVRRRLPAVKQTFGALKGAVVRLPGLHPGPLYLVEGPEDGPSVWVATAGGETWCALGGFHGIDLPIGRQVVVCADDDARHKPGLRKAMAAWRRQGIDFSVVRPWSVRREDGSDFNDLLVAHGTGAVERRILDALEPGYREREPGEPAIIRWRTQRTIETLSATALHELADDPLPATLVLGPAGSGKTEAVHRFGVDLVRKMRVAGDQRSIAIASPRHELNEEERQRLQELAPDVSIAIRRGHDADDPAAPGQKMCRAPRDYMEAVTRRLDPRGTVCQACEHNTVCGLRGQDGVEADIWLATHQHPLHRKPAELGKLAWLVFDEDPTGAVIFGAGDPGDPAADDKPKVLCLEVLQRRDPVNGDPVATDRLAEFNEPLADALWTMPDGPMQLAGLIAAGITADAAQQSVGLEYDTKVDVEIPDGASIEERRARLKTADINRDLGPRVMLKREVTRQLRRELDRNPRVEVCTVHDDDGPHRAVRMMGKRSIHAGWDVPTIVLSATAQPEPLRHVFHGLKVHDFGAAKAPHRHIRQVVDRAFSLTMLDAEATGIDKKERARRTRNLRDLHAWLYRQALDYAPGEALVVAQKRIIPQLLKFGPLPRNVVLGHHGAMTGIDRHGKARAVIVIGRMQPKPCAMERAAEALSGKEVQRLPEGKWYPLRDAKRELGSGELVLTEMEFHPDPLVEALRWRVCEGELVQLVERGRGINRTAADPLDVWLLTNVPVPLPIDEEIHSEELRPRVQDLMLAEIGRVLENSRHAALALHPDLDAAGVARKAATLRQRIHDERDRYGRDWRPPSGLVRASYRVDGAGTHHDAAWFDPARATDPAAELRALLGPLVYAETSPSVSPQGSVSVSLLTDTMPPEASPVPIWTGRRADSAERMDHPPDG
jgi:putative DNA primase/helicase